LAKEDSLGGGGGNISEDEILKKSGYNKDYAFKRRNLFISIIKSTMRRKL